MIQHLTGIWRYRYFWSSLVRLDLRNRYRRSALGIGWSLLNPIAMTAVFCVAFGAIMQPDKPWQFMATFMLAGLSIWEFLRGSLSQGCESFIRAEAYIRQCPLPYAIHPLRTVLGTFIHFLISLGVVIVAVVVLNGADERAMAVLHALPSLIPAILLAFVFAWSVATLAGFANVFFQDTKHLVDVLAQLFFFVSPIMFEGDHLVKRGYGWILDINPVAYFIALMRPTLLEGREPDLDIYLATAGITAATFALACGTMAWLQKRIVFHL